ncbi:MAG: hypothetical protein DMF67_02835 [Acidobacteria bacterium]|nr:MAG: hypothetical protein DMF66_13575 [Acidobacteriota bacterium]PYS84942.1 MAG: hypothetical protein DMF67_02835 [Acidobacteriota bacterium]
MAEAKNEIERDASALDDRGTDAAAGLALLRRLRDNGFESDDEKLAVALGRPAEEVRAWMQGAEQPDDDIIIKARGIAQERGIEIE